MRTGLALLLLHRSAIASSSAQEQPGSHSGNKNWHLYYLVH